MADTLDIQAIRAMAEAATEGPWLAREASSMKYCALVEVPLYRNRKQTGDASTIAMVGHGEVTVGASELDEQNANCAFIAAARTIVPALCDKVERLMVEGDADDISEAMYEAICDGDGRPRPDALQHHLAKRGLKIVKVAP